MSGLWGGRFSEPLDARMRRFSTSLPVDRRLVLHDLEGSRAHAQALRHAGVLDDEELKRLDEALSGLAEEAREGRFPPPDDAPDVAEDVHSAVEARLVERLGDLGRKLHAGRSRNDQVVTDVLLWLRGALARLQEALDELQLALVERAEAHRDLVVPAYTHLQRAQPVLLAHHLLAHVEALERDRERVGDAARRADRCPLGAGACVGSSLPLDREATARRLGFGRVSVNSLDAVSDRDWAVEAVSACALVMTHLSRLGEELVLWSSQEFGTARLGEAFCTGSSMMPQKRNPDVAELVRGRQGRVVGHLVSLHALLKGLPLAYNRDLQEDKEPLFDAVDVACDSALLLAAAVASTTFHEPRRVGPDFSAATDLAEALACAGLPFRTAHERIGALVSRLESEGRGLDELTDEELVEVGLAGLDRGLLSARGSVEAKRTLGSTAGREVDRQLDEARRRLAERRA